jgi:hypothetical protein
MILVWRICKGCSRRFSQWWFGGVPLLDQCPSCHNEGEQHAH